MYNSKYLETKEKCSESLIKEDFYDNELPLEKSLCMAYTIKIIDLVLKNGGN